MVQSINYYINYSVISLNRYKIDKCHPLGVEMVATHTASTLDEVVLQKYLSTKVAFPCVEIEQKAQMMRFQFQFCL